MTLLGADQGFLERGSDVKRGFYLLILPYNSEISP